MCAVCVQYVCSMCAVVYKQLHLICMDLNISMYLYYKCNYIINFVYMIMDHKYYSMFFKVRLATEQALLMTTLMAGADKSAAPLYVL